MAEILRFARDISFDSALTKTMGAALDGACRTFEKPPSVLLKKRMAERILAKRAQASVVTIDLLQEPFGQRP